MATPIILEVVGSEAFNEGAKASKKGISSTDCPYPINAESWKRSAWLAGWHTHNASEVMRAEKANTQRMPVIKKKK